MKKDKRKVIKIALLAIALFLIVCGASLANYFCSSLYISTNQNNSGAIASLDSSAYLISVAKSQSELSASALANDYENACGYIWKDGEYYHVIHSAADKENDATLIKNALEKNGISAEIISLSFAHFKLEEGLSNEQLICANEALSSFMQSFRLLSDIAVGLDTNVYSHATATEKLSKLKERITNLELNYRHTFSDCPAEPSTALGQYLADQLESISLSQPQSKSLKYHAIEILEIYKNMTNGAL